MVSVAQTEIHRISRVGFSMDSFMEDLIPAYVRLVVQVVYCDVRHEVCLLVNNR